MDTKVLADYYAKRGFSPEEGIRAVGFLEDYRLFLGSLELEFEASRVDEIKKYIKTLIDAGLNDQERLLALARASYLEGLDEVYIYFTQVIERDEIIRNLSDHVAVVAGDSTRNEVFENLPVPPAGSPPDQVLDFTRCLVAELRDRLGENEASRALTANAHGIPDEAFAEEKLRFEDLGDLDVYLEDYHSRMVETLAEHAATGKLWFEQSITDRVVEFVRENPEILGGVRIGSMIYQTKIPYDPDRWLTIDDESEKRYLACHCPMARESIRDGSSDIPALWCSCSAGFAKQRYDVIFGTPTVARTVDSVLGGDNLCRFAIAIPQERMG